LFTTELGLGDSAGLEHPRGQPHEALAFNPYGQWNPSPGLFFSKFHQRAGLLVADQFAISVFTHHILIGARV